MVKFVLIHGAWHGAWCWDKIIPLLKSKGYGVEAIDLPDSGEDKTPISQITFMLNVFKIKRYLLLCKKGCIPRLLAKKCFH